MTVAYRYKSLISTYKSLQIQYAGGDSSSQIGSVAIGPDGVFIGAGFMDVYPHGWVAKLDLQGNFLWATTFLDASSQGSSISDLVATASGGVVAATLISDSSIVPLYTYCVGLSELSASGGLINQKAYAYAESYSWWPKIAKTSTGYNVLTRINSPNAPTAYSVDTNLNTVGSAQNWGGIGNRTYGPSHLGQSTAAFASVLSSNYPVACKLSGLVPTIAKSMTGLYYSNHMPQYSTETSDGGILFWGNQAITKLSATLAVEWTKLLWVEPVPYSLAPIMAVTETPSGYCFIGQGGPLGDVVGSLSLSGSPQWCYQLTPNTLNEYLTDYALMAYGSNGVTLVTKRNVLTPNQLRVNTFSDTGLQGACSIFGTSLVLSTTDGDSSTADLLTTSSSLGLSTSTPHGSVSADLSAIGNVICLELIINLTATYSCTSAPPITGVSFLAAAAGGTAPYTYAWTFGDGSTGTGANPTHDYSGLGPYTVIVTATDSVSSTASASLIVQCAGTISTSRQYFVDCPTFTREQALELPITDSARAYTSKNASIPFTEDVLYTVYSRHSTLSPVLGAVPTFSDNWFEGAQEKKQMYAWLNPVSDSLPSTVYILNFALRNATDTLPYLTNDGHGSFFVRLLPDTPGEILGFKSAPYIDQTGSSLESPLDQTKINKTYMKLVSSTGVSTTQTNHVLASNPYATLGNPPVESFTGENPGDQILGTTAPKTWEAGTDKLQWLDNKSVQWGILDATESRGLRFYITGCQYDTIMELMISDFQGDSSSRIKRAWLGSHRVCYFGLPGDKIRWYMTHRCGEPIPFTPIYGGTNSAISEAQNSPLTCLVSAQDQPPTVTITSCPASGGGGGGVTALALGVPDFTTDCSPSNPHLTCASVMVTVSGGQAPIQASCHVSIPGDPLNAGPTTYQTSDQVLTFLWDPILAGVSAPIVTTVTVTDSLGATVTTVQTLTSYTPITCPP